MTYETTYHEQVPVQAPPRSIRAIAAAVGRRLTAALRRMQHGRMIEALNSLTDAQLAAIGLQRSDIPAYARRLVYETD